jgi:hypothetical protein
VTVSNSTLSANSTVDVFNYSYGGGIYNNRGTLTVTNSTLSANSAGGFGGGSDNGGGIYNSGTLTVTNSTLFANSASSGGDGIYNYYGTLTVSNSTLAYNSNFFGGDDIENGYNSPLTVANSIVEYLLGSYTQTYSLVGVDAGLDGLDDYGGPTETMPLLPGSPAIGAGDPVLAGTPDQRGVVRTGGVNIGAFQASASTFLLTAPATSTAGAPFDLTVRAVDPLGQPAVGYTGTAHLSSSDGQAALPADYTFTLADGGSHTFHGVALRTAGTSTVTATDDGALTGSGTVTVTPAAADHILLSGPASASAGTPFDLVVTIQDAYGNTVTGYTGTVTFSTDDPNGSVPADYTFTADDAGTHTFAGGVTLYADGSRVTATDTQQDSLTGSIVVPLG